MSSLNESPSQKFNVFHWQIKMRYQTYYTKTLIYINHITEDGIWFNGKKKIIIIIMLVEIRFSIRTGYVNWTYI